MSIIDHAFDKYKTVLAFLILILFAGASEYSSIQKEAFPDVSVANIFTTVTMRGMSPADGVRLIVKPTEEEIKSVQGLKELTSNCFQNYCMIQAEFIAGWNSDKAQSDVKDAVDKAKPKYPTDADEPTVQEFSTSQFPIINVNITGDIPERTLLQIARDLQSELEGVKGVSEVDMGGSRSDQIDINLDPAKMASYGLTIQEISQMVQRSNTIIPAGNINSPIGSFPVQIPGLIETVPEIMNLPLKADKDSVVKVNDIATVLKTYQDATEYATLNGKRVISLEVKKLSEGNVLDIVKEVRKLTENYKQRLPQAVNIFYTSDSSVTVRNNLKDLENSVILSVLLVMIVVILMLGTHSGLLVGLSIPASFLMGIIFVGMLGLTMNMMVLFGLILSVGMLVDGAIVVTEYADQQLARGATRKAAYKEASKRMAMPIISSTATTLAAFSPLIFWPGMVGQFMKFMPITLICVLTASLFVALIFVPVIGAFWGPDEEQEAANAEAHEENETEKQIQYINKGQYDKLKGYNKSYYKLLSWALDKPKKIIWGVVIIMILSVIAFSHSKLGAVFFPDTDGDFINVNIHALGNLSPEQERDALKKVEVQLKSIDGIKTIYLRSGAIPRNAAEDTIGYLQLELKDWKERDRSNIIISNIRSKVSELPGMKLEVIKQENKPTSGKPFVIELTSNLDNFDDLRKSVKHIEEGVNAIGGFEDIEDTAPLPGIQWEFEIDRAQAAKYHLDVATIGMMVQLITQGARLTSYRPADSKEEVWIVLRFPEAYRKITELDNIQIPTSSGNVPISNFVKVVPKRKVSQIKRIDKKTVMEVKANIADNVQLGNQIVAFKAWLEKNPLKETGVNIKFRGEQEDSNEASAFLGHAFLIAIFLIGLILLAQFNNFYYVALILSAIFLSVTGVLLGLVMTLSPFVIVMTGIAVVSLAGVVVNNNIVLIDTYAELKGTLQDRKEEVIKTGVLRLRPVLLTTITTILGLMPMAFKLNIDFFDGSFIIGGPSMDMWAAFSRSVIFGLTFSTILTLVFTPCMLYLGVLREDKKAIKKAEKKALKAERKAQRKIESKSK